MDSILDRLKKIKNLKVSQEHSCCDSLYGHMSEVRNLNDFFNYPNLKKANPQKFFLKKGECLIIPNGWWHHVTSNENTYGCNFWTSEKLSNAPVIMKHDIQFGFDDIKDDDIYVWTSNKILDVNEFEKKSIKFKEFIDSKNQNEYFWTLKNYNILNKNNYICDKILNKIKIPEIIKNTNENFEFNIMACSKKHVTHLHYDDEDGLLCVTDGLKEIVLFPPEDIVNLYPVKFKRYKWKDSQPIKCVYNFYKKGGEVKGNSSSNLLYETCKNNIGVLSTISKIIENFHGEECENKTIWSYKKCGNEYKWELYNYENLTKSNDTEIPIVSYEIYPKRSLKREYVSHFRDEYYIKNHNQDVEGNIVSNNGDIYRIDDKKNKIGNWIMDTQINFFNNFEKNLEELKYNLNIFNKNIIKKYNCSHIYVPQRNNNEFYIMYIGINNDDFLNFLVEQKYNQDLIDHYKNNDYNISNEISLIYDISDVSQIKIKRSSFFGIL
jgi:hypothetical protein